VRVGNDRDSFLDEKEPTEDKSGFQQYEKGGRGGEAENREESTERGKKGRDTDVVDAQNLLLYAGQIF